MFIQETLYLKWMWSLNTTHLPSDTLLFFFHQYFVSCLKRSKIFSQCNAWFPQISPSKLSYSDTWLSNYKYKSKTSRNHTVLFGKAEKQIADGFSAAIFTIFLIDFYKCQVSHVFCGPIPDLQLFIFPFDIIKLHSPPMQKKVC